MSLTQHDSPEEYSGGPGPPRRLLLDRAICLALAIYGITVLLTLLALPHFFLPAEDAVILHQYSKNLAEHGAITYYAGGPHAEGATDLAWMLLVAAGLRAGVSPAWFTAAVNVATLLLLGLVLLRLAGMQLTIRRLLIIAGAAGLVPQIVASGAGFAVLPDALMLTLLVASFVAQRVALSAMLALLLCLFRPDGILFAAPLLLFLQFQPGNKGPRAARIVLIFLLPGLTYFIWRMTYFHAFLPLPFTVKSDVHRTLGVLVPHSFTSSLKYLFLNTALLVPLFWRRHVTRLRPLLLPLAVSLLAVPTLFYWSMRLDQNVGDRFFFYLPLAAVLMVSLEWPVLEDQRRRWLLRLGTAAFIVFLLGPLQREVRSFRDYQFYDVKGIAAGLHKLPRGTLLTTEAGFITYGSDWIAYDAWGLNTSQFAMRLVQPSDVVQLHPDLIVVHPDTQDSCLVQPGWPSAYTARAWPNMTRNLVRGASDAGDYELWLISYGSPFYRHRKHWRFAEGDRECLLIRNSSPSAAAMKAVLQQHGAIGPPQSLVMESTRALAEGR